MDKKKKTRNIYTVWFSTIFRWSEENGYEELDGITEIDGVDPTFETASISKAYSYYREHKDDLKGDGVCELLTREIEVTDEEWIELLRKEKLDDSDYSKYANNKPLRVIAWNCTYEGLSDGLDLAIDELLVVQSENFNMRVVCNKAGISYSTFRGFKNNKQPFSPIKKYELLRCMGEIGKESWDEDLENMYQLSKSRDKKW